MNGPERTKDVISDWPNFMHLSRNEASFDDVSKLVEYAPCLPDTLELVERVFSAITKISITEKTRLEVQTLKSILFVKNNFTFSCLEFYEYLKKNED